MIENRIINGSNINGSNSNEKFKIVNGEPIPNKLRNKFNFLASIVVKNNNHPFCGGAYIGKNVVLTAAHCVNKVSKNKIQIMFKKKYSNSNGIRFNVNKIIIHPNYNSKTADNDIALIFLKGRPWKKRIKPLYLPSYKLQRNIYKYKRPGLIMDFGSQSEGQGNSITLQYAKIKMMKLNQTKINKNFITKNMIIMGDYQDIDNPYDNIDTCFGDSGTSVFGRYGEGRKAVSIGITSWGIGCGLDGYPGVYAKTGNYIRWIYNLTKIKSIN